MHKRKLISLYRTVSVINICILIFLFFDVHNFNKHTITENREKINGIEYKLNISPAYRKNLEFATNLETIFSHKVVPQITNTVIIAEQKNDVPIPELYFVGMVETDKKTIYSFRNRDTNKLFLLQEGVSANELTLLPIDEVNGAGIFVIKKQNITFQVDTR